MLAGVGWVEHKKHFGYRKVVQKFVGSIERLQQFSNPSAHHPKRDLGLLDGSLALQLEANELPEGSKNWLKQHVAFYASVSNWRLSLFILVLVEIAT